MRRRLTASLLCGAGLCIACGSGTSPAGPPPVALDLVRQALAADPQGPWTYALFGTPRGVPWLAEGFVPPADAWLDEPYVWARRSVELRIPGPTRLPRRLLLDLAPHPQLDGQTASLFLNEQPLGSIELGRGRRRHLIELPPRPREREARLRVAFARGTEKLPAYRRSLAAALHAAVVGVADDPALEILARDASPPLLASGREEGVPTLIQAGPGSLRFALRAPARGELRFIPRRHPASGERSVELRVALEAASGEERELWRGLANPGSGTEVAVSLGAAQGSLLWLSLQVLGEPGARPVWVEWKAPRVLGEGASGALKPAATAAQPDARVAALRHALSGSNVLLIVLDAASAQHVGAYGHTRPTTPEIDRLAAEGVLFERAFTPAVYTLPAMASLWTSRQPDEHRNVEPRTASLQRAHLTLPDLLAAHGIVTGGFVANGMAGPGFGFDRGFDEFREIYREFGQRADADSFREVLPGWFAAQRQRRFFAYVHYREPHWPYDPKPPFDTLFGPDGPIPKELRNEVRFLVEINNKRRATTPNEVEHIVRLYDGNLAFVDHELGFLRRTLEEQGLWERSVVIVTSDHGEEMGQHGLIGHESQLYDPALHIPLLIRFPAGTGPRGLRVAGLVDLLDLGPTIAELFGLLGQGGSRESFSGRSLLPMLFGAPGKPGVVSRTRGEQPRWSLRDERFKLIWDGKLDASQLFDLDSDPGETRDLAASQPLLADLYRQSLHALLLALRPEAGREADERQLTPQQLENLRALGYVH